MSAALTQAILRMLRPLVRILLRNGVPFGTFAELARWVYVDVALSDFVLAGRKMSDSRASILTGLSRKEVRRLRQQSLTEQDPDPAHYNRAARVLTAWQRDESYCDDSGAPLELDFEGESPTFSSLVLDYSGDVPARAILDELLRVEAVEKVKDGRIKLCERAYIPSAGETEKLAILGTDVAELIRTIDRNLQGDPEGPMFQRKVAYDNLPREAVEVFRALSRDKNQQLLEEFDRYLAAHDRDLNPQAEGSGRWQAGVGIYYFDRNLAEPDNENGRKGRRV